ALTEGAKARHCSGFGVSDCSVHAGGRAVGQDNRIIVVIQKYEPPVALGSFAVHVLGQSREPGGPVTTYGTIRGVTTAPAYTIHDSPLSAILWADENEKKNDRPRAAIATIASYPTASRVPPHQ
ncbi:hypothetical protein THAOC_19029, partial [Thalassiosira oceanica]